MNTFFKQLCYQPLRRYRPIVLTSMYDFNLAILPASGSCASFMEKLTKDVIGSAIKSYPTFRNLPLTYQNQRLCQELYLQVILKLQLFD